MHLGEKIMSRKRKTYSAEFKTKIVLELLSGEQTVAQIASKYEITAKSLTDWKKQFLQNASLAFDLGGATKAYKDEIEELIEENDALAKKLGKTTIERDWAVGKLKSLDLSNKKDLVNFKLDNLSVARQCEMIDLNRSSLYYEPKPVSDYDLKVMSRIDEIYTDISSTYGYRFMHQQLLEDGYRIGVNKVNRLMNVMGIQAIFPKKRKLTSIKNHEHRVYPYLLRDLEINRPNQVWSADITYIRTYGGFMYLAAIIDWNSRSILGWKLSNTMDTTLVTDVLKGALNKYGTPDILNTDQGSQYTSHEHTQLLKQHNIQISMNGKGRSIDNIAIERFFRTLKYDEIYINEYQNVRELREGINKYMYFYNHNRFHSALGYKKPMNVYLEGVKKSA
jgi:putative transposase